MLSLKRITLVTSKCRSKRIGNIALRTMRTTTTFFRNYMRHLKRNLGVAPYGHDDGGEQPP